MEYVNLGRSGLKVSRLCLGTMTFGESEPGTMMHKVGADEATSHALLNHALEEGINFIDTADVYGQDGLSERVIGNWFETTGRRNEVVLATKFRFRMRPDVNGTGASRYHIVEAVENSLRRLKTDRIDLYQVHMQDIETPEEETLRALDDLVRQGKVLYIGASNYAAYRLMESLWAADKYGTERFVALQPQYNLLSRELEREHVLICQKYGLGILPWSPLASGLLSGKYRRGEDAPGGSRLAEKPMWLQMYDRPSTWDTIETVVAVAEELGVTPAQVALAWLLHQKHVASIIIGVRNMEQLESNLGAVPIELPGELLKKLDEVSRPELGHPYDFIRSIQGAH